MGEKEWFFLCVCVLTHMYLTRLSPSIETNLKTVIKKSLCFNIRVFLKSTNRINPNRVNIIDGRQMRLANTCLANWVIIVLLVLVPPSK